MADDSEDLVRLRKAVINLTEAIEADGKARREQTALIEAQTKQLAEFNTTLTAGLAAIEQLMPMLEGAAQGSTMLGMGLNFVKNFMSNRRRAAPRADDRRSGPRL